MRLQPLLLALLLAAGSASALLQAPEFLKPARFKPHPRGCPVDTVHLSFGHAIRDEAGLRKGTPTGFVEEQFCWPLGQVLQKAPRNLQLAQVQDGCTTSLTEWRVELSRTTVDKIAFADAGCGDRGLACKEGLGRRSATAAQCTASKGKVVAAAPGDVTCSWADSARLDLSGVRESGMAVWKVNSYGDARRPQISASFYTALADAPGKPCVSSCTAATCFSDWCNLQHPQYLGVGGRVESEAFGETEVQLSPVYPMPVGGTWRLTWYGGRGEEADPYTPRGPGTPIKRHLVSINPDLTKGTKGLVVREGGGPLLDTQTVVNLTQLLAGRTPGWNQIVMQAKAEHKTNKLIQTGSLGYWFEQVAPCPAKASVPFYTHVLEDSTWQIDPSDGHVWDTRPKGFPLWLKVLNLKGPTYALFTVNLSFLNPKATVHAAALWFSVNVVEGSTNKGDAMPIAAYDGATSWYSVCSKTAKGCLPEVAQDTPCVPPLCKDAKQVGSGVVNGKTGKNKWFKLNLSKTWVTSVLQSRKPLKIAMTLPWTGPGSQEYGALFIRDSPTGAGPFVTMRASC
ncbi:hypothetical protein C2E20_7804 [Micractinium conductrix]|uniref:Uncharacterized protein n=1 Tax=Micractinium conductrix TaxID=554055 RepID=A0A2P6V3G3_9CHLO|nr:hypothetical protein C2E20_7804 [Micractinium conductrix]|eukprot:PSC68626.1 hypothetical protein C2E20_7804 [Micractinium conductrix]